MNAETGLLSFFMALSLQNAQLCFSGGRSVAIYVALFHTLSPTDGRDPHLFGKRCLKSVCILKIDPRSKGISGSSSSVGFFQRFAPCFSSLLALDINPCSAQAVGVEPRWVERSLAVFFLPFSLESITTVKRKGWG